MVDSGWKSLSLGKKCWTLGILVGVFILIVLLLSECIFRPWIQEIIVSRRTIHCLPIASEALEGPEELLVISKSTLAKCWVITPDQVESGIWYGVYEGDPYGLEKK